MAMIFFLKMLCDASLYYMFAAPIAGYFGGGRLMACMFLQCLIYFLSRIPKNRVLRFLICVPLGICFVFRQTSLADVIALIPITLYMLLQSLVNRPGPDISRQRQWLEDSWKVLLLAAALGLIVKDLPGMIPWAAFWLLSNIALLRTLRHENTVRSDPRFHFVNLGLVAAIPAVSICASSQTVVSAVITPLGIFYRQVFVPGLVALLWFPFLFLQWLMSLLFPPYAQDPSETVPMDLGEFNEPMEQTDFEIPQGLQLLFWVVLALTAAVVLFLLLRSFLNPQRTSLITFRQNTSSELFIDPKSNHRIAESFGVQRIRKQYRRFLKLCHSQGITRTESTTSQDIDIKASSNRALAPVSCQIRRLYIKARYAGKADSTDVKEMLRLYNEAKKNAKNGR